MTEPMGTGTESSFGKRERMLLRAPAHGEESGLFRVAELADELGAEVIASAARAVTERVAHRRRFLRRMRRAIKRGKSTLVNALIGQRVLPAGVISVTGVATVVRYREHRRATFVFKMQAWNDIQLSESKNAWRKGIRGTRSRLRRWKICVGESAARFGNVFCGYGGLGSITPRTRRRLTLLFHTLMRRLW